MSAATDVDTLLHLMPPPPQRGPAVDWDAMARSWGRRFPPDYQRFIEVYGGGVIEDFLVVLQPQLLVPREQASMTGMVQETLTARSAWDIATKSPQLQGTSPRLMAWGGDSSADLLCWDASAADPADWPMLVFNRDDDLFNRYDCGMAVFLTRLITNDFPQCPVGYDDLWARGEASWQTW